jgi:hypothetical protein
MSATDFECLECPRRIPSIPGVATVTVILEQLKKSIAEWISSFIWDDV